jgi:UDP-N-acetylglucosamine 1-carboxyvinyltransferase
MDKLKITGGKPLRGEIMISGAKNAALPLMITTLLTDQPVVLNNIPDLADIRTLGGILASLGTDFERTGEQQVTLKTTSITNHRADYDLVRKMRASVFTLGPLLARNGYAEVSLPGGCAIGTRPVDLHIKALEALGATITIEDGYIKASAKQGLTGGEIIFPKVSVGATENALMAATLARGETIIRNAAREPEVGDLAVCLNAMGAKITGLETDTLKIEGVTSLSGAVHSVLPDRIETGSYAIAALMTGGELTLTQTRPEHLQSFLGKLRETGADVAIDDQMQTITIASNGQPVAVDVMTKPYPGYPTDLQAQIMALNCIADGAGMVTETIFENRFMHVPELTRMGANITIHGSSALVRGTPKLAGAPVMATDLRASMALVLAGLAAQGETTVSRIYHLDRGYDNLENKLRACGADIQRVKES